MKREVELVRRTTRMPWDRTEDGGHSIRMAVIGARGAVTFTYVPDLPCWDEVKKIMASSGLEDDEFTMYPQGVDLSYHSPAPLRDWQVPADDPRLDTEATEFVVGPQECDLMKAGQCWNDGSIMRAKHLGPLLRKHGEDAIWEFLGDYYHQVFYDFQGVNVFEGSSPLDATAEKVDMAELGETLNKLTKVLGQ